MDRPDHLQNSSDELSALNFGRQLRLRRLASWSPAPCYIRHSVRARTRPRLAVARTLTYCCDEAVASPPSRLFLGRHFTFG